MEQNPKEVEKLTIPSHELTRENIIKKIRTLESYIYQLREEINNLLLELDSLK